MPTSFYDLFEPDALPTGTVRPFVPDGPHGSMIKAFGKSAGLSIAPTAGGVAAAPAGAEVGAFAGSLIAPGPGTAIGAVIGGGAAAIGGGYLVDRMQTGLIHMLPQTIQQSMGLDDATLARDRSEHPTASFLGSNAPGFLFFRPTWGGMKQALTGGAINSGIQTGQDLASTGQVDWMHTGVAFGVGASFGHTTKLGDAVQLPVTHELQAHGFNPSKGWAVERVATGAGRTQAEQGAADTIDRGLAAHGVAAPADDPVARAEALQAAAGEQLTPDERAAVHVANDAAVTRGTSPFQPGPAGDQEHGLRLGATLQAILHDQPLPPIGVESAAHAAPAPAAAPDAASVKAAIATQESGGSYTARNPQPGQTASGKYQFTDGSWQGHDGKGGFAREVFPGKSDAELRALKADPAAQEAVMDHALATYGRTLRAVGAPETPGNLYLLHFLGPKGIDVLRADASTPVEALLPAKAIAANRAWLQGKTAGDLVRDMAGRAGGAATGLPVRPTVAADATGPVALSPLYVAPKGEPGFSIEDTHGDGWLYSVFRDAEGDAKGVVRFPTSDEARQPLPDTRYGIVSYVDPAYRRQGVATRLYDQLREAGHDVDGESGATDLTPDGAAFVNARRGFRPNEPMSEALPPAKEIATRGPRVRKGPIDVATFLADQGGIADTEGHDLVQGRNLQQKVPGAGNLIKPSGMSVDAAGEALWDRGYFGPPDTTPRPTEAEVLDLLEQTKGGKIYHPEDQMRMADEAAANPPPPEHDEARAFIAGKADEMGLHFDNADLDQAAAHVVDGVPWDSAIERVIADRFHDANLDAAGETGQPPYEGDGHALSGNEEFGWPSEDDLRDGDRFDPSGPDAGDAGEGGHGLDEPAGVARLAGDARGDAARLERFDDPAGDGLRAQIEALEHDLRMDAGTPLFHGSTRDFSEPDFTASGGIHYTTPDEAVARQYAQSTGGGRGPKSTPGRTENVRRYEFSRPLRLLDLRTPEGRAAIASIDFKEYGAPGQNKVATIINAARNDGNVSLALWMNTKDLAAAGDATRETFARDLVTPLESAGYDGVRFDDADHETVGLFGRAFEGKAEQSTFRLDAEGGETTIADALAAADADEQAASHLRACLPAKGPAA